MRGPAAAGPRGTGPTAGPAKTPGGPDPFAPRPDGLRTPFTLGIDENVKDPGAWQLWWEFNKDRYLRYSGVNTGDTLTGTDEFSLGKGETFRSIGGRVDDKLVQERILPAIQKGIELGGDNEYVKSGMMGLAKIGGAENFRTVDFMMRYFLVHGEPEIHHTAAAALGIAGYEQSYSLLTELAKDSPSGREQCSKAVVPMETRAFAAYGLGLIGQKSTSTRLRTQIVADLIALLEEDDPKTNDVQVAAMVSLGLIPLEMGRDVEVCICGECEVKDPSTSYQAQVTYLMRYFTADTEYDPIVRAHTASTLARLVDAGAGQQDETLADAVEEIKLGVCDILVESLQRYARQPHMVRESAVMALGLVGDADNSDVDTWIRRELGTIAKTGKGIEQRFALMALAEVGSRRGQGEHAWAGTADARADLLQVMTKSKKSVRPWATLALGVFGNHLALEGQERSLSVDKALERMARGAKSVREIGAIALAAGLRQTSAMAPVLIKKMESLKDETSRSYVAVGLGLLGDKSAINPLQEALTASTEDPLLAARAGLALGLLGDNSVIKSLLGRLEDAETSEEKASIAGALGFLGDRRSIEALVALLEDREDPMASHRSAAMAALGFMADRATETWRARLAHGTNYLAETPTLVHGEGSGILNLR